MARTRSAESIAKEIEALKKKEAELKARMRETEREEKARREKLAGAAVIHEIESNPDGELAKNIVALLDRMLTGERDRELFGFAPRTDGSPESAASAADEKARPAASTSPESATPEPGGDLPRETERGPSGFSERS